MGFKLKAAKFALAGGIVWGALMFISTILSIFTGYASGYLFVMRSIYPGITISWGGAFLGLIYGFLDGFICLFVLAWLYNKFCEK